jgi:hypothetical protein
VAAAPQTDCIWIFGNREEIMITQIARLARIAVISGLVILSGQTGALAWSPSGSANRLGLPSTSWGGTVATSSEVDYYKFDASAGCEVTVWLETESIGSNLAAVLALLDGNGTLLAYNDGEWNAGSAAFSGDPILYLKLPETSTYYFAVASAAYFNSQSENPENAVGAYRINLFHKFDGPIPTDFLETNDSPWTATEISLPFQSHNTNLLFFGDIDWFSFDATEGRKINVDIDALELGLDPETGIPVKARVGIFDANQQLVSALDTEFDPDTGFNGDHSLIFDVPNDGRYYIAVTTSANTQFSTPYNNPEFLQNPYVSGAGGTIGIYTVSVRELQYLCIPQFALGDFDSITYKTRILLLNPSEQTATGSISLFKSDGTPFAVTFSLPGGSDNIYWFSIPPKGQLILDTDVEGPGSSGYARIISTESLAGSATFSQYDAGGMLITEAAAEASQLKEFLAFPVDIGGGYNTGLAVANMSRSSSANLYFRLVDTQGNPQGYRDVSLDPGKQISLFAGGDGQLFPSLTDFRGSLQVFADSPISAIALRTSSRTLTTLPVLPMNQSFDPANMVFSDMVAGETSGKSYRSTLIMTNPSYFSIRGKIQFTQTDGSPMPLSTGARYSSQQYFEIPPQGTIFLEPCSAGGFFRGYATVSADHGLGGVLIYSQFDAVTGSLETEAAVPASTGATHFLVPAESQNGYSTGLAIANPNLATANLFYALYPDSNPSIVLENGPVSLAAGHQKAQFISGSYQIFDGFDGTGVLEVISDQPLSAVAIRMNAATTTMLPVVPIR